MKNMKKRFAVFTLIFGMLCSTVPESYVSATSDIDTNYSSYSESCTITEDCILEDGHEGDCVLPDDYGDCTLSESENNKDEDVFEESNSEYDECILSDSCVLDADHEGECMTQGDLSFSQDMVMPLLSIDIQYLTYRPVDEISAYFGNTLSLQINTDTEGGSYYYYFILTDNKAGLNYADDVFTVMDESGQPVEITKTEDGFYFVLNRSSSFTLDFVSDENADSVDSNPAVLNITGACAATLDMAKQNAASGDYDTVTFTWSATSDVVSYMIDLYWKTAEGNILKDISVDTTQSTDINVTYVLSITTSSSEYEANQMEIKIPYVLWQYRDGTYCKPVEISVPEAPDVPANNSIKYNYHLDNKGTTDDESDDEIVFTNYTRVSAGTNTTIEVHYTIKPELTIDMSKSVLKASGSCRDILQISPELKETDEITYQLDTGLEDYTLRLGRRDASWSHYDIMYRVDMLPEILRADADFENYKYIRYHLVDKLNADIQGHTRKFTITDPLCDTFDILYIFSHFDIPPYEVVFDIQDNQFSSTFDLSSNNRFYEQGYDIYVRYPYEVDEFNPTFTSELIAYDDDSHSEADGDHNDILTTSVTEPTFTYRPYHYDLGHLYTYGKSTYVGVTQGVSQLEYLKNRQNAEVMKWQVESMYNGNLMAEGDKQKGIVYDDFHFWNLGENGEFITMTDDDYEIDKVRDITVTFERANLSDGSTYFPEASGDVVVNGYRNGGWEEVARFAVDTERLSEGTFDEKKYLYMNGKRAEEVSLAGQGFTRVSVETPALGVGRYVVHYWVDSRIKPESETLQNYLVEHEPDSIRIHNFMATKHLFSSKDTPGVWSWNDKHDNQECCFWIEEPPEDIKLLIAERDKAENNYGETTDDKWMGRTHNWIDVTGLQKESHLSKITKEITDDTLRQRMHVIYQLDEYDKIYAEQGFDTKNPTLINQLNQQEGIFYDLLPVGYCYDDTVEPVVNSKYGGDAYLHTIEVIDNYKGSGRQLVKFHVKARNISNYVYRQYSVDGHDLKSYDTGFDVTFSAYIPWDELVYYNGTQAINLAAFQSGKDILGTAYADAGYPDVEGQAKTEFNAVLDADGNPAFADIDGDGVTEEDDTLYAYSATSSSIAMAIEAGIDKKVRGNSGVYQTEDITSANDSYSYKIGVTNTSSGVLKNLIIYDILENAANKEGATGESTWKGIFDYVDTSKAESFGISPVVYYSTVKDLDYNEKTGDTPDNWYTNTTVWSTTCPTDKSKVTAVAVDLSHKTDGSEFEVPNNGGVFFEIYMKAPSKMPQATDVNKIYAINRPAYSCYRQTGHNTAGEYATVIGTRVKIRLDETQFHIKKDWKDSGDWDGLRPDSVTVQLKADGVPYSDLITLSKDNNWEADCDHLPKTNFDGEDIVWSVGEVNVPEGYTSTVTGNQNEGFLITNKHDVATFKLSGKKIWIDGNDVEHLRPNVIYLKITGGGSTYRYPVSGTGNEWSWELTLPKIKAGQEINYTVEEYEPVGGYESTSNGTNVTNTLTRVLSGKKVWKDNANHDHYRPGEVVLNILNGDIIADTITVKGTGDTWNFVSKPLPKYGTDGNLINYTIQEVSVPNYISIVTGNQDDGFVVTNTHDNDTITISGKKVWDDDFDRDHHRPDKITISILNKDTVVSNVDVTGNGNTWNWTSDSLPKYDNDGELIIYTIKEASVPKYDSDITGNQTDGFIITNTHKPDIKQDTIVISGKKIWNDHSDKESERPMAILVKVIADKGTEFEKVAEEITVSDTGDSWEWSSKELPKFRDGGVEIDYTLDEMPVENYHSVIVGNVYDGFVITNTHELMPTPTPKPTPTPTESPEPKPTPTESPEPFFIKSVPPQPPVSASKVAAAPRTGDDRIIFWMKILLISGLGIAASIIYMIRSKKRSRSK